MHMYQDTAFTARFRITGQFLHGLALHRARLYQEITELHDTSRTIESHAHARNAPAHLHCTEFHGTAVWLRFTDLHGREIHACSVARRCTDWMWSPPCTELHRSQAGNKDIVRKITARQPCHHTKHTNNTLLQLEPAFADIAARALGLHGFARTGTVWSPPCT